MVTEPDLALLLTLVDRRVVARVRAGAEVMACPRPFPLPDAPAWLLGLGVGRDQSLPLVDLGPRLGAAPARGVPEAARVLVSRAGGLLVGYVVQDVARADPGAPGSAAAETLDLSPIALALVDELQDRAACWGRLRAEGAP